MFPWASLRSAAVRRNSTKYSFKIYNQICKNISKLPQELLSNQSPFFKFSPNSNFKSAFYSLYFSKTSYHHTLSSCSHGPPYGRPPLGGIQQNTDPKFTANLQIQISNSVKTDFQTSLGITFQPISVFLFSV
jgi:hypothetical protein